MAINVEVEYLEDHLTAKKGDKVVLPLAAARRLSFAGKVRELGRTKKKTKTA